MVLKGYESNFFVYIERIKDQKQYEQLKLFTFAEYPHDLNKKVTLLQHFRSYLNGNTHYKDKKVDKKTIKPPSKEEVE